jgi:hypothetical protein
MQRFQTPALVAHRIENSIRLSVAGIGLNGIPAVNDLAIVYKHDIRARMRVILETNTSDPSPAVERGTKRKADIANASSALIHWRRSPNCYQSAAGLVDHCRSCGNH